MNVPAVFAHRYAIIGFPIACGLWLAVGGSVDGLTLALSILAISTTQLVLASQEKDTGAVHRKLDEIVHGVPDADDGVAGCEQ